MASKINYLVVAVLGISVVSGAAWWYQTKPQGPQEVVTSPAVGAGAASAPKAAGVEVAKVEQIVLQDDAQAVGTLRSRQSVMLRPEVPGRVLALGFADGERVRKGQLLVQLDDTLQRAELKQAQAQVSIAQANFKRNQELVAQNFVAQRVLDESAANLQVAQAQQALGEARLARMAIRAPFAGTVGMRVVNLGDFVKDGADLVNLEDGSSMLVDFRLPERFERKLQRGQVVELALDAFAGRTFKARVQAIDPLLDANGRSVGVRAVIPADSTSALRAGMFARVTTIFGVNDAALVIPEEAIVPQGGKQFVIKVVAPAGVSSAVPGAVPGAKELPPDAQWVSLRQEVKLGVRGEGKVEITQGLALGETVVTAGQQRLQKDGTPVRIVELGRPADKASAAQGAIPAPAKSGSTPVAAKP